MLQTEAERINERLKKHKTKLTKTQCRGGCGVKLTNNQLKYSLRVYGKALCFSCQRLDKPLEKSGVK